MGYNKETDVSAFLFKKNKDCEKYNNSKKWAAVKFYNLPYYKVYTT